jgi:hypothetical protein
MIKKTAERAAAKAAYEAEQVKKAAAETARIAAE